MKILLSNNTDSEEMLELKYILSEIQDESQRQQREQFEWLKKELACAEWENYVWWGFYHSLEELRDCTQYIDICDDANFLLYRIDKKYGLNRFIVPL